MSRTPRRSQTSPRALRLQLAADLTAPSRARALAEFELRTALPAERAESALLLLSELVTNAVIHPKLPPTSQIEIKIEARPTTVYVEVADAGPGFDLRARTPAPLDGGGNGLILVQELAEKWGVAKGPTRVWFVL